MRRKGRRKEGEKEGFETTTVAAVAQSKANPALTSELPTAAVSSHQTRRKKLQG
jgi:Titin Z